MPERHRVGTPWREKTEARCRSQAPRQAPQIGLACKFDETAGSRCTGLPANHASPPIPPIASYLRALQSGLALWDKLDHFNEPVKGYSLESAVPTTRTCADVRPPHAATAGQCLGVLLVRCPIRQEISALRS